MILVNARYCHIKVNYDMYTQVLYIHGKKIERENKNRVEMRENIMKL